MLIICNAFNKVFVIGNY